MVSADGYFEGKNNDISWHRVDKEVNDYFIKEAERADTILFGRKTYQLMESFWPTQKAIETDPGVAEIMNSYSKIVFSKTLENITWNNTLLIKENLEQNLDRIKSKSTKDIMIFGSAHLCQTLIQGGFIDEFRLMINPVVLGAGRTMFENIKMEFQLLKTRVFGNGNILCQYIKRDDKL